MPRKSTKNLRKDNIESRIADKNSIQVNIGGVYTQTSVLECAKAMHKGYEIPGFRIPGQCLLRIPETPAGIQ